VIYQAMFGRFVVGQACDCGKTGHDPMDRPPHVQWKQKHRPPDEQFYR
jgi:hypothetical protein